MKMFAVGGYLMSNSRVGNISKKGGLKKEIVEKK